MSATRNLIAPETADRNRMNEGGGYTFNALIPDDYEGVAFTVAALRLGDHAHLDVHSGRNIPEPFASRVSGGRAGRLVLRWHEWEVLRGMLDQHANVRIAEVERPRQGQIEYHFPASAGSTERKA